MTRLAETELDQLMAAIHDAGYLIAIHSRRDTALRCMVYELWDVTGRRNDYRLSDEALAMAVYPEAIIYESVRTLLAHYFRKTLKQPEAFKACLLIADIRMSYATLTTEANDLRAAVKRAEDDLVRMGRYA